jgi:hypothetical protein
VTVWPSLVGGFRGIGRAKYRASEINGMPALEFGGGQAEGDGFDVMKDPKLEPEAGTFALMAVVKTGAGTDDPSRIIAGSLLTDGWRGFALTGKTCVAPSACTESFGFQMQAVPLWGLRSSAFDGGTNHLARGVRVQGGPNAGVSRITLYVDGIELETQNRPQDAAEVAERDQGLTIGHSSYSPVHNFRGSIAEVLLFIGPNAVVESKCAEDALRAKYAIP